MELQPTAHNDNTDKSYALRNLMVVALGTVGMVTLALGAMMMLTSPEGWVMKAANHAVTTAHEGTLASYTPADSQ